MTTRGYEVFDEDSSSLPDFPSYNSLQTVQSSLTGISNPSYYALTVASTSAMILTAPNTAVPTAKRRRVRPAKAEEAYKKQQEEDVRVLNK